MSTWTKTQSNKWDKITSKKKLYLSKEAITDGDIRDRSPLSSQIVSSLSLMLENLLTGFVQRQNARGHCFTPGAYAEKTLGMRLSTIIEFHFQSFRRVANCGGGGCYAAPVSSNRWLKSKLIKLSYTGLHSQMLLLIPVLSVRFTRTVTTKPCVAKSETNL